jgi:hypothetical protein
MTAGERFIASLPLKERFYDAHERRAYQRSLEVARRIIDDPSLLDRGRAFLERFVRNDIRQRQSYQLWVATLGLGAETVARRLVADDERGERLRESAPVFSPISEEVARRLAEDRA